MTMRLKSLDDLKGMTARVAGTPAPVAAPKPAPVAAPQTAMQRLQAKGRLKAGEMNKTEARFVTEWIEPRVAAGEVVWWGFEVITLKLAPDCRLTLDFFVMLKTGELQAWDVKGSFAIASEDFLCKAKVAADKFPWPIFMTAPIPARDGGGWKVREFK